MLRLLQVVSFLPMLLAARLRRLERRVVQRATAAGATVGERAILLEDAGRLGDFVHTRLRSAGVLISAGNDRYYFDAGAYDLVRRRRRRRAWLIFAALLSVLVIGYLRGELG